MKHNLTLLALILLCGQSFGDTLILKGGKKVEWKLLRDKGNLYEVELLDGSVQTILKKDVERVEISDVQPVLAGASISFAGKTKTADLLGAINPKRDVVFGVIKGAGGAVQVRSEIDAPTIVKLPIKLPDEYDVTIVVERKSEIGNFYVGLTSGDRSFMVDFDTENGSYSHIPGGPGRRGTSLEKGKPALVLIQVRKDVVLVSINKKEFLSYKGSPSGLNVPPNYQLPNGEVGAFIGAQRIVGTVEHANFIVSRILVTFQP